jgi:FkbM family methyltransferase
MNREHIAAQLVLRSWPFQRGIGRMIERLFGNPVFKEEIASVPTTDGINIRVYTNDLIGRHIYLTGEYERSVVEVLCNFSEPGDTLLDIGANIGYISACFLKNVPHSKAVAIDPQPGVLDLLRSNLSQFSADRYRILPVAVSDHDGTEFFSTTVGNRGDSYLTKDGSGSYPVQVRSADSIFDEIGPVDMLKIDVQGHEEQILRSVGRIQPRAILFEETGAKSAPSGLIARLLEGYKIYGVQKRLFKNVIVPIRRSSDCISNDYLAVSRSRSISQRAKAIYGL